MKSQILSLYCDSRLIALLIFLEGKRDFIYNYKFICKTQLPILSTANSFKNFYPQVSFPCGLLLNILFTITTV